MIATISKEFTFSAAHQLAGLADGHQCGRLHGHNYVARLAITGTVDLIGMVLDYGELKPFGQWLDDHLDHRNLNDVLPGNPTAEHLASYLVTIACDLIDLPSTVTVIGVSISETPKTWATVTLERG